MDELNCQDRALYRQNETALLPATAPSAQLIHPDVSSQTITPTSGHYTIQLPACVGNLTHPF